MSPLGRLFTDNIPNIMDVIHEVRIGEHESPVTQEMNYSCTIASKDKGIFRANLVYYHQTEMIQFKLVKTQMFRENVNIFIAGVDLEETPKFEVCTYAQNHPHAIFSPFQLDSDPPHSERVSSVFVGNNEVFKNTHIPTLSEEQHFQYSLIADIPSREEIQAIHDSCEFLGQEKCYSWFRAFDEPLSEDDYETIKVLVQELRNEFVRVQSKSSSV